MLDKWDFRILAALEENARQPLTVLAKKLRTSQQVISYRLKRLEKEGIIGGYFTLLDLSYLGYTPYRTMVRLSSITPKAMQEILVYLTQHPNVLWLVECGGRWDILVNFMAKNIGQYNQLLQNLRSRFPAHIQNVDTLTTVEVMTLGRDYLTKKERETRMNPYFGGETKQATLDDTDYKILSSLAENARTSSVAIAQIIGISASTVIQRIKQLEKKGIIQGYRPLIHLEKTPFSSCKALIKFHNATPKREEDLMKYLKPNVMVTALIRQVGQWDFEIEFEVKNREQLLDITREIRDQFQDIIRELEVVPLYKEYKYNFFPGDLLKTSRTP